MRFKYYSASHRLAATAVTDAPPSASLLRPFLDLSGPGDTISARICHRSGQLLDADDGGPLQQGNTRAGLRAAVVAESGLRDYVVDHPAQLPPSLRSTAWSTLVERIDRWSTLDGRARLLTAAALNKLSFYPVTLRLVRQASTDELGESRTAAALESIRVSAEFKCHKSADRAEHALNRIVRAAPAGSPARLAAAANLVVHHAKLKRSRAAVAELAGLVMTESASLRPDADPVDRLLLSSVLRGACFDPFADGDHHKVTTILAQAHDHARLLLDDESFPRVVAEENLYALTETMGNAARGRGDLEAALAHSRELAALDPLDCRARLVLADILWSENRVAEAAAEYRTAAMLGAPTTAVAWYCVARCAEVLEDFTEAVSAYLSCLTADPMAVSALLGIRRAAVTTGDRNLAAWATRRLNTLHRVRQLTAAAPSSTPER